MKNKLPIYRSTYKNGCTTKLKNRRVVVEILPDHNNVIGIGFKMLTNDPEQLNEMASMRTIVGGKIVETKFTLSREAAVALCQGLIETLSLSLNLSTDKR